MPPIRDVMPAFELFQPASVTDALGVLNRHGADAWVMAGGMDTFDWLKDRIKKPKVVVDLSTIKELTRRWYPGALEAVPRKATAHRALDDIRESIGELRWYREHVFRPAAPPA